MLEKSEATAQPNSLFVKLIAFSICDILLTSLTPSNAFNLFAFWLCLSKLFLKNEICQFMFLWCFFCFCWLGQPFYKTTAYQFWSFCYASNTIPDWYLSQQWAVLQECLDRNLWNSLKLCLLKQIQLFVFFFSFMRLCKKLILKKNLSLLIFRIILVFKICVHSEKINQYFVN